MFVSFTSDLTVVADGFVAIAAFQVAAPPCSGVVSVTTSGTRITDGSLNYGASMSCTWNITRPSASLSTVLSFTTLDTIADTDFVIVYNASGQSLTELARFSGQTLPAVQVVNSNVVVTFTSSASSTGNNLKGFAAVVTFEPPRCSGLSLVTATNTSITDGAGYLANQNCSWNIVAPSNSRVLLSFSSYLLGPNDTIKVYDNSSGTPYESATLTGGNTLPAAIRTSASNMIVVWTSGPSSSSSSSSSSNGGSSFTGFSALASFEIIPACSREVDNNRAQCCYKAGSARCRQHCSCCPV